MIIRIATFIICLQLFLSTTEAQNFVPQHAQVTFPANISINPEKNITAQIHQLTKPNSDNSTWQLASSTQSPVGYHFNFRQFIGEYPVYGGNLKLNVDKNGKVLSIFDNSIQTANWDTDEISLYAKSSTIMVQLSRALATIQTVLRNSYRPEIVIYPGQDALNPTPAVFHYSEAPRSGICSFQLISADGKVLESGILNAFYSSPDSNVVAKVFLPDPLTSAKVSYGGQYTDQNDADVAVLNAQLKQVSLPVKFDGGVFSLENATFVIKDLQSPNIPPATSTIPEFDYLRGDDNFEDVNAFYHLNTFFSYVSNLGFTGLLPFQLQIDTHGSTDDNSYFLDSNPPRLIFGEGGVDDAEDADVIIHELSHALAYGAAPGTTSGFERLALDEGLGDYFAASYSRSISDFKWYDVFSWDGHNEFWQGRQANSMVHYPEDLGSDIYLAGQIWSSAMMEVWEIIGRENTDKLMLQALYSFAQNMTMKDAAQLVLQADDLINGGAYYEDLLAIFTARGLMGIDENKIAGSQAMLNNIGNLAVYLADNVAEGKIEIFNLNGALIYQLEKTTSSVTFIDRSIFHTSGMYVIRLTTADEIITAKAIFIDN